MAIRDAPKMARTMHHSVNIQRLIFGIKESQQFSLKIN